MQGARQMCQAMFRLAVGLQMVGRLLGPAAPYNSEEQRFEQRFMAYFPQTSPQHLDYPQFEEAMNVKGAHDPHSDHRSAMSYACRAKYRLEVHDPNGSERAMLTDWRLAGQSIQLSWESHADYHVHAMVCRPWHMVLRRLHAGEALRVVHHVLRQSAEQRAACATDGPAGCP